MNRPRWINKRRNYHLKILQVLLVYCESVIVVTGNIKVRLIFCEK
jgi:hypothetical protein